MLQDRDQYFFRAVFTRPVLFTYIFFAANILVYILTEFLGGADNERTLLALGAKWNDGIRNGELWRLIAPTFLHGGIVHIAGNSFTLWNIGPAVEKFYGRARFVVLYVATGIGAALTGYLFSPDTISVGASGSLMGLCGALMVFGLKNRDVLPAPFRKKLLQSLGTSLLIILYIGFRLGGPSGSLPIDNAGHIGGLLAGALLATVIPFENPFRHEGNSVYVYRVLEIVSLTAVIASFGAVYLHYNGPAFSVTRTVHRWNPSTKTTDPVEEFRDAILSARSAYAKSLTAIGEKDLPAIAEASKNTAAALDKLRGVPSVDETADTWVGEFLIALQAEYTLEQAILHADAVTAPLNQRAMETTEHYRQTMRRFNLWVETEGRSYGLTIDQ